MFIIPPALFVLVRVSKEPLAIAAAEQQAFVKANPAKQRTVASHCPVYISISVKIESSSAPLSRVNRSAVRLVSWLPGPDSPSPMPPPPPSLPPPAYSER